MEGTETPAPRKVLGFSLCEKLNLETVGGCEKAVQGIYVHREFKKLVVTFWVKRDFCNSLGA
ncbi:MAG: hypothetical protein O7F12_15140 [Nitrospirae bacterium]|nr:hypothetical protein [Nitrospirota bacterium]